MTLKEIRDAAYELLGITASNQQAFFPPSQMDVFINMAYKEFVELAEISALKTTLTVSDAVSYVALPSDFMAIELVLYKGTPLEPIQFRAFDWSGETRSTGRPFQYHVHVGERRLYLDPGPNEDGAYLDLYYYNVPVALVEQTDSPTVLPSTFHHNLAYYAAAEADASLNNLARASMRKEVYDRAKKQLIERLFYRQQRQSFPQVLPVWDDA